ncbi:unnamed protein product [Effrenium voratum]|nr:unnamed protein product [Effrenium voratum]
MALKDFGRLLAQNCRPQWRYIACEILKEMLRDPKQAGSFLEALLHEIAEVNAFQQLHESDSLEGLSSEELQAVAMIKQLAAFKLLQKHERSGHRVPFCTSGLLTKNEGLMRQATAKKWTQLCQSLLFMSAAADVLSRLQGSQVWKAAAALEHKTCHEIWAHPTLPLADAKDAFLPKETRVKLMTWNACSLSFPLRIHPAKLLLGIFLGFWWHDPQRDVPLQVRSRAARERCQRQAEYIRQSGADLIMLQEMLSTTMLETLMCHLASDFDCAYLTCRPTLSAVLLWTLFLLTVAFWQCALLQICLMVWSTSALGFCGRWLMLAIWLALRSRGAVPFHFLCGDVAGQLVVLRRQTSRLEACVAKEFQAFDALGHQLLARSWLCVFFNVRPRGILRVTVPLGPRMGSLTLLNTHLPHNSDNSKLLRSVSSYASSFACHGPVVLAGDFNPQPHIELQQQLKPLLAAGLVPTDGLEEQHCTWDLQQPLTRRNPGTPRTMQLDFIFLRSHDEVCPCEDASPRRRLLSKDSEHDGGKRVEARVLGTAIVDQDPSLEAAAELMELWDQVTILAKCRPESDELRRAVRGFNSFHRECFRAGLATLIDTASDKWRACRPFRGDLPKFLQVDCICVRAFNPFYPPREEDRCALAAERSAQLNELAPSLELQRRLWQLPAGTVSVHIRRTDHKKAIARSPEELFMQMMDSYSEDTPFFLATDDPAVEARFKARYGGRLLTNSKRSLDRHAPEGIQDALLDLLLLSQGCEVLGSYKSSFSAMAAHFHMVPLHVVDVCPDAHQVQGPAFREVDLVPEDPEAEHSGVGWQPAQPQKPRMQEVRKLMAEAEMDFDGEKDEIPEDDEIPDDDEIDDEEDRRFGLQFEQVVPDAVYSATAEDGMLTASTSSDRTLTSDELEEQIADRWWSQVRRFFFRHNYRAYRLVDGSWQQVPDPRGPRFKPRRKYRPRRHQREQAMKRLMRESSAPACIPNVEFDLPDSRLSPRASQRWERGMEEFLSSLGVGEALPAWLKELRVRQQEGRLQEASGISPPQLPRDPSANRPAEPPVDSPPVAVSTPGHVARGSESQAELPNPSFKEWLQSLDSNGFLVQYHDDIASKFDSVAQIVHIYAKDGVVDQQFFEDTSIKKLGGPEHV